MQGVKTQNQSANLGHKSPIAINFHFCYFRSRGGSRDGRSPARSSSLPRVSLPASREGSAAALRVVMSDPTVVSIPIESPGPPPPSPEAKGTAQPTLLEDIAEVDSELATARGTARDTARIVAADQAAALAQNETLTEEKEESNAKEDNEDENNAEKQGEVTGEINKEDNAETDDNAKDNNGGENPAVAVDEGLPLGATASFSSDPMEAALEEAEAELMKAVEQLDEFDATDEVFEEELKQEYEKLSNK